MTVTINGTTGVTAPEVTLDNSSADGGQVVLKSSGYSNWNIDNYNGSLRSYYGSTVATTIDTSGNVGIGTSSPGAKLNVIQEVRVSYQSGSPYYLTLSDDDGDCRINANGTNAALLFGTTSSGGVLAERMRIDSSGNLLVGKTVTTTTVAGSLFRQSGNNLLTCSNDWNLELYGAGGYRLRVFDSSGGVTQVGAITASSSSTTYATSSDYRLKENIQPMQNALDVVAQLNPVTYTWKADGSDGQGFIAHELQAVVPDCVTGEKDAVDAEGKPVYQGIDTSFLVATLTKAIQELTARVEQLEAK